MESSVVLFKPSIHLFACTHPSVSNSLDRNEWLAYKHQSTARVQTRLDCASLLYTSISFHLVFQTCLDCGSLSAHTHQYPALFSNTFVKRDEDEERERETDRHVKKDKDVKRDEDEERERQMHTSDDCNFMRSYCFGN